MNESLFSKIMVAVVGGVLTTVIGYIAVELLKPTFSNEPSQKTQKIEANHQPAISEKPNAKPVRENPATSNAPISKQEVIQPKEEDYSVYINPLNKSNVSVIILDGPGTLSNSVSNAIAQIYRKTGKTATVGLIRSAFVKKPQFQELCEGNSEIIQKLKLGSYADYLAIGRIQFTNQAGKLVNGTMVCTASISMSIISTSSSSITDSFVISNANGNGATESQAKEDAIQKLLNKYYSEHASL